MLDQFRLQMQRVPSERTYEKHILPEGRRQGDVHFDPDGKKVCGTHGNHPPDVHELRLAQWLHFIRGQEELYALGAHGVGRRDLLLQ